MSVRYGLADEARREVRCGIARAPHAVVVDRLSVAPALVRYLRPMRAVCADAN
jgi:hypothetical protein